MSVSLPPQLRVFVRDWLSGNQVVMRSADGHVVVDSGFGKHVPLTLALVASRQGLDGGMLALLVNTHCHSDHMGGNAALKRAYGCPIALPQNDFAAIEAWDTRALLLDYAGQHAERFTADRALQPDTIERWGDLDWRMLAAPGHDMGALVFYNEAHRILISGDALWHDGFGVVMPPQIDPQALPATRATLDMLASLDVAIVIPGHGEPFTDYRAALDRAYSRLTAFEADTQRVARHVVKVMLTFTLLDRERMPLAGLPDHVTRVPLFAEFNARYLRRTPEALAQWLVDELTRVGAARVDDGMLVSPGAAPGIPRRGSSA
jgi:glyoxylase-like metal-dependent hydrolase (beta-lactamase superfamily II)